MNRVRSIHTAHSSTAPSTTNSSTMPWHSIASAMQDRRPAAELAGLHAAGEHAEPEHRERQRDGERELPRHRALHVAAVDREALVEQEDGGRQRHQLGHRVAEPGQATERPAAHRQRDEAEDRDELERDAVREHDVERDDHQRRHDHVEAVEREPVVPVVAPAAELEVRQQVVAQVRRAPSRGRPCRHRSACCSRRPDRGGRPSAPRTSSRRRRSAR